MILWVVLLCLVVAISFVLATQSMRDFTQVPKAGDYSLFLVRNTRGLDSTFLNLLSSDLLASKAIISFERLFKGRKSALVVFGPSRLILNYKTTLDLLELEDYTNVHPENISTWEVGVKNSGQQAPEGTIDSGKVFSGMPHLSETEQFWWQVIISSTFKPQITAIVVASDPTRKHALTLNLHNLAPQLIYKLPKVFSDSQLFDFYQKRSFRKENKNNPLSFNGILQLLLI